MASILKKQTKQEFIDEYQFNTILHTLDLKVEKYKKINDKVEYERWKGLYDWLKSKKSVLISEKLTQVIITNEKKAEELRKTALPNPLPDGYGMWLCASDVDEVLVKMAEWKDEQHSKEKQQWIEKACEWLKDNIYDYYTTGDGGDEFEGWFDDMFEDFKEAMEE